MSSSEFIASEISDSRSATSISSFVSTLYPVPEGTSLPITTFSLSPLSLSTFPVTAASVKTRVVSWKDAAEINDSVAKEAFVIPSNNLLNFAGVLPSAKSFLLTLTTSENSTWSPIIKSESPDSVTSTYRNICLRIHSMCLSLISTPCNLYTSWISFTT